MIRKAVLVLLLAAPPAGAQIQSRPTEPPLVTAANEQWYQLREPIQFAGDLYFPAGAAVFFNGNTMARTGHYNGVPLYADTTLEPFSVVLVPVGRGLMQPYERRRQGDLVGTTGSRTPSFPVGTGGNVIAGAGGTSGSAAIPQAPAPPTRPQQPIGAIGAVTLESSARPAAAAPDDTSMIATRGSSPAVETARTTARTARQEAPIVSLRRPEGNDGLWVQFGGSRWISAGPAVPLRAAEFRVIGQHAGFPVFARSSEQDRIYLPTRAGLVAPYRLK